MHKLSEIVALPGEALCKNSCSYCVNLNSVVSHLFVVLGYVALCVKCPSVTLECVRGLLFWVHAIKVLDAYTALNASHQIPCIAWECSHTPSLILQRRILHFQRLCWALQVEAVDFPRPVSCRSSCSTECVCLGSPLLLCCAHY